LVKTRLRPCTRQAGTSLSSGDPVGPPFPSWPVTWTRPARPVVEWTLPTQIWLAAARTTNTKILAENSGIAAGPAPNPAPLRAPAGGSGRSFNPSSSPPAKLH